MSGYLWFVLGVFTGVSLLGVFNFFNTKFTKDKPIPEGGYNEHNLPKGCELIDMGGLYMFKINGKFADVGEGTYYFWTNKDHVNRYCVTTNKQRCIERGIETFEFFKALGKI